MQLTIFDNPETGRSRKRDPDTAKAAAKSVEVSPLEDLVLDSLRRSANGLTTEGIAEWTELPLVTVSPRLRPLCRKDKVYDSGERRIVLSGRRAIVWKAK